MASKRFISCSEGLYTFEGAVSVEVAEEWVAPWRIDFGRRDFFPFLQDDICPGWSDPTPAQASGVRICLLTDSEILELELDDPDSAMRVDLYSDGVNQGTKTLQQDNNSFLFADLGSKQKAVEIWLDPRFKCRVKGIWITSESSVEVTRQHQQRWIHYGSSISQSRSAASPSRTWTAMVARLEDLHLTNLGFGANCLIEPMVGLLLRDLQADIITCELGINTYPGRLGRRMFSPNTIGFIEIIRQRHPYTPLYIISPIFCPEREEKRYNEEGMSLVEMRSVLEGVVQLFRKHGDSSIYYINGLDLFGPEDLQYLPDGLHPDANGQEVLSKRFRNQLFRSRKN